MSNIEQDLIFAFDLGTGSMGECVRQGEEIKHIDTLLIDPEFAATKDLVGIRRGFRTRNAHKARENWWREQAALAGIEVLETRQPQNPTKKNPNPPQYKPDTRMLKEFPSRNENIIYNSALLRIALLQGEKLEGWQIFKAIWSAIQHRGYDENLPWANKTIQSKNKNQNENTENQKDEKPDEKTEKEKKDEKANLDGMKKYREKLKEYFGDNEEYHLPCYYEASTLGIWDIGSPRDYSKKLNYNPPAARNKNKEGMAIAPRVFIVKEIEMLLKQAAKQYSKLEGKEKFLMYGEGEQKYASYESKKFRQHRGTEWDLQGLLGQKIPRFDNRMISKCCLIPRFNVCKADDPDNQDVTVLMQLLNMRFFREGIESSLTVDEFKNCFEKFKANIVRKTDKKSAKKVITARHWENFVKNETGGNPSPAKLEVEQPKSSGRSRFCRPVLKILKDLILFGKNPHDYYNEITKNITNTDKLKGLVLDDYKFLLAMPNDWKKIHIPDFRDEEKNLSETEKMQKIMQIIGEVNNPVVRHRLEFFLKRIKSLGKNYGTPDKLFVEIAREEFMSEEKKRKYESQMKANRKEIENATNEANGQNVLKMRLFREQGGVDVYDLSEGKHLSNLNLDEYEIDHIVPRSLGGSDSIQNKVLTKNELNQKKLNRTPYEWFFAEGKLAEYLKHIKTIESLKRNHKKIKLLTSKDSAELERIKTDLQATMYLEKLTQRIASLYFGWGQGTAGDDKKIYFVTGGRTAQIRKRFGLDKILHPDMSDEEFKLLVQNKKLAEKNRKNARHHALDALVISFAKDIKYDENSDREHAPYFFNPKYCKNQIEKVYPETVKFTAPKLRETIYGLRKRIEKDAKGNLKNVYYMVSRFESGVDRFKNLADARKNVEKIFDLKIKNDFEQKLNQENLSQEEWEKFWKEYTQEGFKIKKITKIDSAPFSAEDVFENGKDGKKKNIIGEYKNMGKIDGQYLKAKGSHQGQIVYIKGKDKNGINTWAVEPVFVFDSIFAKLSEMKAKYGKVHFFKSGQLVELMENINEKIEREKYYLSTLRSDGWVEVKNVYGEKLGANLDKFMNIGKMRRYRKEK